MTMNKTTISIGLFILATIALLTYSAFSNKSSLSGAQFVDAYRQTPGAVLLDVRTAGEYAEGHLDGALNMDVENSTFNSEIAKLDKSIPYFVYCRSGSRSAQATAIMRSEGFKNITELNGGIISNQNELTLVSTSPTEVDDYTVDAGDMVNEGALISQVATSSSLSQVEINGLLLMREEEKLAHDIYTALGSKWGAKIFSNIASSELTHTNAIKTLLDRYAIPDPALGNANGVFQSVTLQKLYDELLAKGQRSLDEALIVGATVEDLDIRDLDVLVNVTDKQDILITYQNLQKGSRNHLRAFVKNLSSRGYQYTPQYISQTAFSGIVQSPQERGRI